MVIGRNVTVSIVTPDGDIDILAKVDTGAYSSSLDESFFKSLNLDEKVIKNKMVRNVHGEESRDVYNIDVIIKEIKISSELNVFDRGQMKYKMIIGRQDIKKLGALVDITKEKDVTWNNQENNSETSWGNSSESEPTSSSWATGFLVGGLNEEQHFNQYCSENGGMIIASNYEACDGWSGVFESIPLDGGDCSHIDVSSLNKFRLKANKVYLGNSTFLHESLPILEDVKRQLIRITLPNDIKI